MTICFKNGKIMTCQGSSYRFKKNFNKKIPDENLGAKIRTNLVEAQTALQLLEKQNTVDEKIKTLVNASLKSLSSIKALSWEIDK